MSLKCILFILMGFSVDLQSAITYEFSSGRLGDNLISYLHAKWIAYKHHQTLLYRPFTYSDKFKFHQLERPLAGYAPTGNAISILKQNCHNLQLNNANFYRIPYFSDFEHEHAGGYFPQGSSFVVNWQDKGFKELVKQCIAPIESLQHIVHPPESCISVAMHVRKGGRYETWHMLFDHLKFPPNSFFAEQLAFVCKAYPGKKIYAFIFTDDLNPDVIAAEIAQAVTEYDVTIDYRLADTSDTTYVLDDFFSLPLFDVLIRPCSNFSYVAGKLGDYLLEISPKKYCIVDETIKITAVDVVEKGYCA